MITVFEGTKKHELAFSDGETILDVLQNAGIRSITAPCGGKGICKKCTVDVHSKDFSGSCLACTTLAEDRMVVELVPETRISISEQSNADIFAPNLEQSGYAVACDIGTTTVVCQLLSLETGQIISGVSGSNNQRIFGGDVLSRLKAAEEGSANEIHIEIINQINTFLETLCNKANVEQGEIKLLTVTGNTIMLHFFAGLDPAQISISPFTPVSLFGETVNGRDIGLNFAGDVYICPAASAFIGGDVLCGILSCGMADSDGKILMVDLGTNTEIVIGNKDQIIACSVDGGAAFKASLLEHGMTASSGAIAEVRYIDGDLFLKVLGHEAPKGICGSGFIDLLGILYEEEILDEIGQISDPSETDSPLAKYIGREDRPVFYLTEDHSVLISEEDISKFILAKAAISAGIQILAKESKTTLSELDRALLGGAFGTFAHRRNAALLGIIPSECRGRTAKYGNIALAGAISAALSEDARRKLTEIRDLIKVVNLPSHPSFSNAYMDAMIFG